MVRSSMHSHVVAAVARQAFDRRAGDLAGEQLLELALAIGAARIGWVGAVEQERARRQPQDRNGAHFDLLQFPFASHNFALSFMNESCLSPFAAAANSCHIRSPNEGIGFTFLGDGGGKRDFARRAQRLDFARAAPRSPRLSGSACTANRALASVYSCAQ